MALTWLSQSRRPAPSIDLPLGAMGAVWFLIHLYAFESVPTCSTSKDGSLSHKSLSPYKEDECRPTPPGAHRLMA
eukprot:scaffold20950_cov151-Isochrysis_galbana.AAC.9